MPACEARYAFFHKSLFDWLTGWDIQLDRPFAGSYYVSLKQGNRGWPIGVGSSIRTGQRKSQFIALDIFPSIFTKPIVTKTHELCFWILTSSKPSSNLQMPAL